MRDELLSTMFILIIIFKMKLYEAMTPILSVILGTVSGFYYRDELYFPTNMRIKVAVLEYHMLTR